MEDVRHDTALPVEPLPNLPLVFNYLSQLRQLVRYTLVHQLSSRGYQPVHWYFSNLFVWTNPLVVILAVYSIRLSPGRGLALWIWIPVVLLSALPHKEARYLVPALPFLSIAAAVGAWHLWHRVADTGLSSPRQRAALASVVLVATAAFSLLLELGGFRFRERSGGPIQIAKYVARQPHAGTVAAEQAWRAGGQLYLPRSNIVDLIPERTADWSYLCDRLLAPDIGWAWLRSNRVTPGMATNLRSIGYQHVKGNGAADYKLFRRDDFEPRIGCPSESLNETTF